MYELTYQEVPFRALRTPSRFRWIDLTEGAAGQAKIEASAASGAPAYLSADQADAVIALAAFRATALIYGGSVPLARLQPGDISPFAGSGVVLLDPSAPMLAARHDAQGHAAILAIGAAIRGCRRHATFGPSAVPDVPPPLVIGTPGEKFGLGPAVIAGGVAAAVLLVGGAGYLIGAYREEAKGQAVRWQAQQTIALRRAQLSADLALERWRMEVQSGMHLQPSPLEEGAANDIKELAKSESGSRWGEFGIAAALGAVGAVGLGYAFRRAGVSG
jgi:hypothetical protein